MRKHIYLHSSNFEITKNLTDDSNFEIFYDYDAYDFHKSLQNEYGRIKTDQNYYHILLGNTPQEGCPWCKGPAEIIKVGKSRYMGYTIYCIQCVQCGSRGPNLNICESIEENKEISDEYISLLWQRYKTRRPWDDDLNIQLSGISG